MKSFLLIQLMISAGTACLLTGASTIEIYQSYVWEDQPFAFTVFRRGDTNIAVSVTFATTTNGTARAGVDFVPASGRLEFAPGETSKEVVRLIDNGEINAFDNYKQIEVWLSNPSAGATLATTNGLAFINDNEIPVHLDLTFAPSFVRSPSITAVAVQPDDKILVAGNEIFLGGQQVSLVRLNADGSFDTSFSSQATAGREISHVALATDGKVLVAGTSAGGAFILSRLLPNGEDDPTFRASEEQPAVALVQSGANTVLWNEQGLRRLNPDGSADGLFNQNTEKVISAMRTAGAGVVLRVAPLQDEKFLVLIGGPGGQTLFRLHHDGSRDPAFPLLTLQNGSCIIREQMLVLSDGRVLVGTSDESGFHLVRIQGDGTIDKSFHEPITPLLRSDLVRPIAELNGLLYYNIGTYIFRSDLDGSLDASFVVRCDFPLRGGGWVNSCGCCGTFLSVPVAVARDSLLCWGEGLSANGVFRSLARIPAQGSPANGFIFESDRWVAYGSFVLAQETEGTVEVRVRRTGNSSGTATVHYATRGGTARAGQNYMATEGTLTFAPLETRKTIHVALTQDNVFRGKPHFFIALSEPSIPASLDRPVQVDIYDREPGLIAGNFLRRRDGSAEFEYDVTGQESLRSHIIEKSQDLKKWVLCGQLGGGFWKGWEDAISPRFVRVSPGENHGYYRARRDPKSP